MDQLKYWLCCNFLKRDEFEAFILELTSNCQSGWSNIQTAPWLYVLGEQHILDFTSKFKSDSMYNHHINHPLVKKIIAQLKFVKARMDAAESTCSLTLQEVHNIVIASSKMKERMVSSLRVDNKANYMRNSDRLEEKRDDFFGDWRSHIATTTPTKNINFEWCCSHPSLIRSLAILFRDINLYSVDFCKNNAKLLRRLGGLVVILDGLQKAKRLENQLKGRAGRQGDPGETQHFISLDESIVRTFMGSTFNMMTFQNNPRGTNDLNKSKEKNIWSSSKIQNLFIKVPQQCQLTIERYHHHIRMETKEYGEIIEAYMIFIYNWRKEYVIQKSHGLIRLIYSSIAYLADYLINSHSISIGTSSSSSWFTGIESLMNELSPFGSKKWEKSMGKSRYKFSNFKKVISIRQKICQKNRIDLDALCIFHGVILSTTTRKFIPYNFHINNIDYSNFLLSECSIIVEPYLSNVFLLRFFYGFLLEVSRFNEKDLVNLISFKSGSGILNSLTLESLLREKNKEKIYSIQNILQLFIGSLLVYMALDNLNRINNYYDTTNPNIFLQKIADKQIEIIDSSWAVFLKENEKLRKVTTFRGFASFTPIDEYRIETDNIFTGMVDQIRVQMGLEALRPQTN
eukprot:gnl/TRDRNA2_/TRDRNA2_178031_c1_seq10.p1 gnl/TRDRNA2_/TRDRNA2_178031_c1~~gnl/TRDRNA2_/TRDRNA2_178031_c1_seq10.p1  ORF type:complete len:627 (-),score=-7.63 gnl/TRDRNA2_/TRDRNA2_178031_c1_seq10:145-2025(-)